MQDEEMRPGAGNTPTPSDPPASLDAPELADAWPDLSPPRQEHAHDPRQMGLWPESPIRKLLSWTWLRVSPIWKNRHPKFRFWARWLSWTVVAAVFALRAFLSWHDADRDFKLSSFAVQLLPTVISIGLAFVPDLERLEHMRPVWRIGIIGIGLGYSCLLWHLQSLNIEREHAAQQALVKIAANAANEHTDKQIEGVRNSLGEVSKHSDDQFKAVSAHTDEKLAAVGTDLSYQLTTTGANLGDSISRVGKPEPPIPARMQFSLWPGGDQPLLFASSPTDKDGAFSVDFTVKNNSPTAIHSADVWINICRSCVFTKEPDGSDRPKGLDEKTAHIVVGILNPGASLEKKTILLRFSGPESQVQISMRYSCEVCVRDSLTEQVAIVKLER